MDARVVQTSNDEQGTISGVMSAAEVSSQQLTPVPDKAPGIIVMRPGTAYEEHILYKSKDDGAGTINEFVRDLTNLNGGTGFEHPDGAAYETLQAAEYVNNIVDALVEGFVEEPRTIAKVDSDTFTVKGDRTAYYTAGRRIRLNQSASYLTAVTSSSYSAGTGLTTVELDDAVIPASLTNVELAIQPRNATDIFATLAGTETLTNKRITPRVTSETSSATPTINTDNSDVHKITALAADITSMTTNLSGTPTDQQKLIIHFKDDGTARAITWGASFEAKGVALPTTTTLSKVTRVGLIYDSVATKWGCVAVVTEA